MGQPSASRAVARAKDANPLAIVIPGHRVIRANGEIGGYDGGLARKRWLIEHEKQGEGKIPLDDHTNRSG